MGRLKKSFAKPGPTRRGFMQRAGGAAMAVGTGAILSACGGGEDDDEPAPSGQGSGLFRHGVASGDPLSDRVILWTRVTPASAATVTVDLVVATDPSLVNVAARSTLSTDASLDYTVKTDVIGLQSDTTYYYRFSAAGAQSPVGRTRTLPSGAANRLRIAVVSCASLAHGYFNAYRKIAQRADLDLVVHLGDYIYEYASGQYGNVRAYEPTTETITLADYRTRHAQYKRDADLQEVHRQHPMVAIWDDHEVANNANASGAANHTEGTEGVWTVRVAAALQAYYEWMPVRVVSSSDLRKNNRIFAFGSLVDLLLLEQRLVARSPQLPSNTSTTNVFTESGAFADPSRQMLGSEEEEWLAAKLRVSTAKWKLVGQGVMFAQVKIEPGTSASGGGRFVNADQWDGYQSARDRVYDLIKGTGTAPAVDNVVILTGDAHSSWAADLTQDPNNPDVGSGGYNPLTGAGSRAVEFVGTSVTTPALIDTGGVAETALRVINPHFKYIELTKHGYMLVDADSSRVVCEWWYVDTVASQSTGESFGAALQVQDGSRHLVAAGQTSPRVNPPALAP
jgi:alkaline phosphatase D